MIKTIVIDDQQDFIEDMLHLIKKNELPLEVIATANNGKDGLIAILKYKPQLVFTDVVMPEMSGFEMLELIGNINFGLIITTAFNEYAVQALRMSALDFLLKPLRLSELKLAIRRYQERPVAPSKSQIDMLSQTIQKKQSLKKIAMPVSDGFEYILINDIMFFEADGNYTTVNLRNGKTMLVTRPIGKFEEIITDGSFFRIHKSYFINTGCIKKYSRSNGGYIVLENDKTLSVSRNKREALLSFMGETS